MGKLLITGGAGFIGSNLAKKAQKLGWKVRVLDNFSSSKKMMAKDLENFGIVGDKWRYQRQRFGVFINIKLYCSGTFSRSSFSATFC